MEAPLLPEEDIEFLNERGFKYKLVPFAAGVYLIIDDFEFPDCYKPRRATTLVVIPTQYPEAKIDMIYTRPDIKLSGGNWPLNCQGRVDYNGLNWQQWSRHIDWRIGKDNLRTFFAAIGKELKLCR